jgi:protein TonB
MPFVQLRGASRAPAALAAIAAAIAVGACSKGEPQSSSARPNAPLQAPQTPSAQQRGEGDVDAALKERLARQEAASKLFEKSAPPPPARPEPKAVPPEPPKATAPEPKKYEPPKAADSTKAAAPQASSPAPAPRAAEPAKSEPARETPKSETAPPRVEVAAAKPALAPAAPPLARLISRVDPEFPREAVQAGADHGSVKARMTLDVGGNVTRVEVVDATPRRLFDRAVVRALSQWKFNDGAAGRTVETEVEFKR